jgi:apolipoprotein N-acyltransferase
VPPAAPTFYRLAPAVVIRLLGLALVGLALVLFVGTAVVAVTGLPLDGLVALVLACVVGCVALGWWLRSRAWVLRCTDDGYRVRLVRGAGVRQARWSAVEDAVTTYRHEVACVQLRLRDGRTTTIPVGVLAVDREQFVRELQGRLQRGHGLKPL